MGGRRRKKNDDQLFLCYVLRWWNLGPFLTTQSMYENTVLLENLHIVKYMYDCVRRIDWFFITNPFLQPIWHASRPAWWSTWHLLSRFSAKSSPRTKNPTRRAGWSGRVWSPTSTQCRWRNAALVKFRSANSKTPCKSGLKIRRKSNLETKEKRFYADTLRRWCRPSCPFHRRMQWNFRSDMHNCINKLMDLHFFSLL